MGAYLGAEYLAINMDQLRPTVFYELAKLTNGIKNMRECRTLGGYIVRVALDIFLNQMVIAGDHKTMGQSTATMIEVTKTQTDSGKFKIVYQLGKSVGAAAA